MLKTFPRCPARSAAAPPQAHALHCDCMMASSSAHGTEEVRLRLLLTYHGAGREKMSLRQPGPCPSSPALTSTCTKFKCD